MGNTSKILNKANIFLKSAGLLKVPDKLLEDAFNFIKSNYCYLLSEELKNKIISNNYRNNAHKRILEAGKNYDKLYGLLVDIKLEYDDSALLNLLDELIQLSNENNFSFPNINLNKTDAADNIGVIEHGMPADFSFKKSKDKYELLLNIDIDQNILGIPFEADISEYPIKPFSYKVNKYNLTPQEVRKLCADILETNKISKLAETIDAILYNFEVLDNFYMKNIQLIYGYCKRFSDNGLVKQTMIDIPHSMLPVKNPTNDEYFVNIIFTLHEERKSIYNREAWLGLWKRRDNFYVNKGNKFLDLGDLYISADPKSDLPKINNLEDLNKILDQLKQTTRHELQHFMQELLSYLSLNKDSPYYMAEIKGLPSKNIRNKAYDPYGVLISPTGENPQITEHALRDIEFYTRLSDSIENFNKTKTLIPVQMHKLLAKAWIADISMKDFETLLLKGLREEYVKSLSNDPKTAVLEDSYKQRLAERNINSYSSSFREPYLAVNKDVFFEKLKKNQPEKYRKAVIEFVKAANLT